jgi:hypothetical protein
MLSHTAVTPAIDISATTLSLANQNIFYRIFSEVDTEF